LTHLRVVGPILFAYDPIVYIALLLTAAT